MVQTFPIQVALPGTLAVIERPRGGVFLDDDVVKLRALGIDVIVSALTEYERGKLSLEGEGAACQQAGLEYVSFPIGNLGEPEVEPALAVLRPLAMRLAEGGSVAVHCWGSVGRAPLLAASLLVLCGVEAARAWELVGTARGVEVPDTHRQRDWVHALEARLSLPN